MFKGPKEFYENLHNKVQLGFCQMYPSPGVIERIGPDWDWIWLDGQHGILSYSDILASVRACNLIGKPAVVRVPGHEQGLIGRALDTGADGVMVPMIDTAEQARQAVSAARFAPLGTRSYGGRRPVDFMGSGYSNQETIQPLLICQIETTTGLKNVREIASVEGVDAVFFGGDDMALSEGHPMTKPLPDGYFDEARSTIAHAAKEYEKFCGGVFTNPNAVKRAVELDYRLVVCSADFALLAQGSAEKSKTFREVI